ncbi:uncharacterized protein LOC143371522 isoform X2 [Andrena cerasifolii]|uniref:uncharacterized protein LOC143371522 isoform X2 n=1 Tax=Andrena cerasifolii TaxID=2819439 RepID=UPI0040383C64
MEWTKEMCLTLVRLYKSKDAFWNPQNPEHYIKSKRNDAWNDVAEQLSASANKPLTMIDCKKKMECILSSFRREKLKIKKISIERDGEEYRSTWFLFDALAFLMDRNAYQPTSITLSTPVPHPPCDVQRNDIYRDEIQVDVSPPPPKISRVQTENERLEEILKPVEQITEDECHSYGMFVANKMKRYSTSSRSAVQHAISDILFNADMGYYERARSFSANTQSEAAQCILFRHGETNSRTQELKNEDLSDLEGECVLP